MRLQAEGFVAMPLEVMVRFGMWNEILAEPDNYPEYMAGTRAFHHAARAIAYAAKGETEKRARSRRSFSKKQSWFRKRKSLAITPRRTFLRSPHEWLKARF